MAKIVNKLNLNKTPQAVENNSLVFAKNIKLEKDGSISADNAISKLDLSTHGVTNIYGHIVGNNKVYLFCNNNMIIEYDELSNTSKEIENHKWTYSDGVINGCVTTNNTGESILTICESKATKDVPIKHINLSHPNVADESLYTQAPKIPLLNLNFDTTYPKTIPNGVYQFFVRYKIRDGFYTNWHPCSKECFSGSHETINTVQGTLRYVNVHTDASSSFVFDVDFINATAKEYYKSFQIGFILSHDDAVVARSWKEFDFDTTKIYFDYEQSYIEEINIDDLTKPIYEIFNVKNITNFKNKLYISNYKETDFNPNITDILSDVTLKCETFNKGVFKFDNQDLHLNNEGLYYEKFGDKTFEEIIIDPKYFSTGITDTENTSKITTSDGAIAKFYFGFDGSFDPDIYFMYGWNKQPVQYEGEEPNKRRITPYNFYDFFGIQGYDFNNNAIYDPFSDYDSETKNLFIKIIGAHAQGYIVMLPRSTGGIHPFQGKTTWWKGKTQELTDEQRQSVYDDFPDVPMGSLYFIEDHNLDDDQIEGYKKDISNSFNQFFESKVNYIITGVKAIYGPIEYNLTEIFDQTSAKDFNHVFRKTQIDTVDDFLKSVTSVYITRLVGLYKKSPYVFYINDDNYKGPISAIKIEYSKIEFKAGFSSDELCVDCIRTNYSRIVNISPNINYITNTYKDEQRRTLMPFTEYEFYIHFVKDNGVITNGLSIGTKSWNSWTSIRDKNSLIYPKFTLSQIPNGYVAWFISIYKKSNEVCQCFNYDSSDGNNYVDCIEEDLLLYKLNDNVTIKQFYLQNTSGEVDITTEAKYYSSGSTIPLRLFGNPGVISWTGNVINGNDSDFFVYNATSRAGNNAKQLIKVTPFININTNSYDDQKQLNLPGYVNLVYKLDRLLSMSIYVAGSDIYKKEQSNNTINIDNNTNYIPVICSEANIILSNYNLNYISLTEEIVPRLRTSKTEGGGFQTLCVSVNTLTSSDIYELKSMYRDYIRKYFMPVEDTSLIEFNNTIRSSNVDTDEVYRDIYRFESTDYYNVPCGKGIIINMFAIANSIYVHTEHSLFKFSGANSLSSEGGEVNLKESEVFNTGVTEIFDAENGFAGLFEKHHSLVTYNSYIFYDQAANIIYGYSGEGQLADISKSIDKVINAYNVTDVKFANDYYNDRFFANIICSEGNICLSFNFNAKSFVSIHDFVFDDSFYTRKTVYFIKNNNIYKYNKTQYLSYSGLYSKSLLNYTDYKGDASYEEACLDVIYNEDYERIKNLNYINWVCNKALDYKTTDLMAEGENEKYGGSKLRFYTDQCYTKTIDLINDDNIPLDGRNSKITDTNSYKYPVFNCGVWSYNYFRDVHNITDIFKYENDAEYSEDKNLGRDYFSDENSLLYGKYFVARFIFNNGNFKFENIHFNVNDYGKVQY